MEKFVQNNDIDLLTVVFSGARRYAGETKDLNYLSQLINYENSLKERINNTIKELEKTE